jgi:hypothetical protein
MAQPTFPLLRAVSLTGLLWLSAAVVGCPYEGDPAGWPPADDDASGDDDVSGDDDTSGDDDIADDDASGDDDSAGDDDSTAAPDPPLLVAIEPLVGPLAGGTEIELTGENFAGAGDVRVHFGALDATVVSVEPGRIVALSPPLEQCMTLDATVLTDAGYSVLTDVYTGCDDFAGATGAIARHSRLQVLDPTVPGLAAVEGVVSHAIALTPTSYSPDDDHPGEGCVRDFTPPSPVLTPRNAGAQVRFTSPTGDVVLAADGSGGFEASGGLEAWVSAADYAVVFDGGPGFGAETVAAALAAPDATLTVSPALDDWQGNSITLGGSLLIQVAGGTPADRLLLWVDFYDGGAQLAGNLVCTFTEAEIPLVSPAFLTGLPTGHAVVSVSRQARRNVELADGSQLASDARVTVVGGWTVVP